MAADPNQDPRKHTLGTRLNTTLIHPHHIRRPEVGDIGIQIPVPIHITQRHPKTGSGTQTRTRNKHTLRTRLNTTLIHPHHIRRGVGDIGIQIPVPIHITQRHPTTVSGTQTRTGDKHTLGTRLDTTLIHPHHIRIPVELAT